jgi:ankyrin repeat protein
MQHAGRATGLHMARGDHLRSRGEGKAEPRGSTARPRPRNANRRLGRARPAQDNREGESPKSGLARRSGVSPAGDADAAGGAAQPHPGAGDGGGGVARPTLWRVPTMAMHSIRFQSFMLHGRMDAAADYLGLHANEIDSSRSYLTEPHFLPLRTWCRFGMDRLARSEELLVGISRTGGVTADILAGFDPAGRTPLHLVVVAAICGSRFAETERSSRDREMSSLDHFFRHCGALVDSSQLNARDGNGDTVLHYAARAASPALCLRFVGDFWPDIIPSLFTANRWGETPWHIALARGDAVKRQLPARADTDWWYFPDEAHVAVVTSDPVQMDELITASQLGGLLEQSIRRAEDLNTVASSELRSGGLLPEVLVEVVIAYLVPADHTVYPIVFPFPPALALRFPAAQQPLPPVPRV